MENQTPKPSPTPPTENIPVQNPAVAETPPQVYTAPHIDNPPPKKPFLTGKTILIVIILSVILSAGGTYLALNSKPKPQPVVQKPTPTSAPTPTPDPTANWKTYINQNLGFSLKYPPSVTTDFVAFDGGAGGNNILGLKGPNYMEGTDFGSGMAIWVNSIVGSDLKSAAVTDRQPIKQNEAAGFGQNFVLSCSTQELKIGNTTPTLLQTCNNIPAHFIYIQNSKGMIIRLTTLSAGNYQQLIDQILSTFKFTEASPTPTCRPRPACLDATPPCLMPETSDMCRPSATPSGNEGTVCTQDAKLCPDGKTYVGRQGPKCEFAACPGNP